VITFGRTLRGDALPWMHREIAVSGYLKAAGAPVVPPWEDPGPHAANGLEVSLWRWMEPELQPVPPKLFGRMLKDLHDVLSTYEDDLPVLVGPLTDVAAAMEVSDNPVLHEAADRVLPLAQTWPRRPLHGDAHTGNILSTRSGPLWMDFEDVCSGPLEWDLASRTLTADYIDAYPGPVDSERLEQCRDLRSLQILAALLTDDIQDASLYDAVVGRLRRQHK
jgi:thiamine kinase-like enzyme